MRGEKFGRDFVQRRVAAGKTARVLGPRIDDVVIHQRIHDRGEFEVGSLKSAWAPGRLLTSDFRLVRALTNALNHGWPHAADFRPVVSIGVAVPAAISRSLSRIASRCSRTTRCCVTTCDS